MAKHVIRYLLEGNGTKPAFVENGGYLPLNDELVGLSVDDQKRHLPVTVHKMTKAELLVRAKASLKNFDGSDMSDEQSLEFVNNLLSELGKQDLI